MTTVITLVWAIVFISVVLASPAINVTSDNGDVQIQAGNLNATIDKSGNPDVGTDDDQLKVQNVNLTPEKAGNSRSHTDDGQLLKAGNLKLTFDKPEEIPSAFFPDANTTASTSNAPVPVPEDVDGTRKIFAGCLDGSGGMCVPSGDCPANSKPREQKPGACKPNQECCFGFPTSEQSCRSRGGECVQGGECGRAPQLSNTECVPGEVCCVFL